MHNEPSLFDDELSEALLRVEAPQGFAESVLRNLGSEPVQIQSFIQTVQISNPGSVCSARPSSHFRAFSFRPALAAAFLLTLLPLGGYLYQRHRHARAEAIAQQFTLAMRLTQAALLDAGQQVAEHGHMLASPNNHTREE